MGGVQRARAAANWALSGQGCHWGRGGGRDVACIDPNDNRRSRGAHIQMVLLLLMKLKQPLPLPLPRPKALTLHNSCVM